jgi:hypothetical protein
MRLLAPVALGLVGACSSAPDLGGGLPLVSRGTPYEPVEGLENAELRQHATGALLSARGEKPIEVARLPSGTTRDHGIRGQILALAGPAPDGRFVYAVRDDRGTFLRRAHVDGRDLPVTRFARAIHALSLSPDAELAAVLAPFDEDDARSRGGALRELLLVDLETGAVDATGVSCWPSTPAWVDRSQLVFVAAHEDGTRWIRVLSVPARSVVRELAAGEAVVVDPEGPALLVMRRDDEGQNRIARVALDGATSVDVPVRGVIVPLAVLPGGLLVAFSAPTLGTPSEWELDLFGPQIALATIKLHRLRDGAFATIEPRASPRRLWSAGGPFPAAARSLEPGAAESRDGAGP